MPQVSLFWESPEWWTWEVTGIVWWFNSTSSHILLTFTVYLECSEHCDILNIHFTYKRNWSLKRLSDLRRDIYDLVNGGLLYTHLFFLKIYRNCLLLPLLPAKFVCLKIRLTEWHRHLEFVIGTAFSSFSFFKIKTLIPDYCGLGNMTKCHFGKLLSRFYITVRAKLCILLG